jgi:4-amino-4-deoxy-L-arabinose transferase-like glycosyltransferase
MRMLDIRSKIIRHLPLVGILLLAALIQLYYLYANRSPMHWDPSNHIANSMRVARDISAAPLRGLFNAAVHDYVYYPPGYFITTAPAFMLFGYTLPVGIAWQVIYLLITMVLIYNIAARIASRRAGWLAAFMFMAFPVVLGLGRMCYIENLLAMQVALFMALLLKDRELSSLRGALLLGLVAGWGQLTKWQFVTLAAPPAMIVFVQHILQLRNSDATRQQWLQLLSWVAVALAAFSAVAIPWYLAHFSEILNDVHYNAYVAVMGNAPSTKLSSIFYYIQSLPWQLIGLPLSLLVYAAFAVVIARPRKYGDGWIIAVGVLLSLALMSVATHKQGRFIMPLLPLIAVVCAVWIVKLRRPAAIAMTAIVLAFSLLNIVTQTFDLSGVLPEKSLPIGFGRQGYIIRYGTPTWKLPPISKENWGLEDIFREIRQRSKEQKVEPTVAWCLEGNGHPYYNVYTLYSYISAYAKRVHHHKWANFWVCHTSGKSAYADGDIEAQRRVEKIGEWGLPDGTLAQLYRCYPIFEKLKLPLNLRYDASDFYFPGFYDAEQQFRWSCGKQARMELPLTEIGNPAKGYKFTLKLSGLGHQRVSISVNGKKCWQGKVGDTVQTVDFSVPGDLIKANAVNTVIFELPDARPPDKSDTRVLAIAIRSLDIKFVR